MCVLPYAIMGGKCRTRLQTQLTLTARAKRDARGFSLDFVNICLYVLSTKHTHTWITNAPCYTCIYIVYIIDLRQRIAIARLASRVYLWMIYIVRLWSGELSERKCLLFVYSGVSIGYLVFFKQQQIHQVLYFEVCTMQRLFFFSFVLFKCGLISFYSWFSAARLSIYLYINMRRSTGYWKKKIKK